MGYKYYYDLYLKAQENNAKYRMFCFNVKNHCRLNKNIPYLPHLTKLIDDVTKDVLLLEKKLEKEIFARDGDIIFVERQKDKKNTPTYRLTNMLFNPNNIDGHLIYFCVHNDSISEEDFLKIFTKNYEKLNLNYVFHYATGLYETNNYIDGGKKYYRGFCVRQLNEIAHKNKNKLFAKKIKDKNVTKSR